MDLKAKHDELMAEFNKAQQHLQALQQETLSTQQTALRIEGAIAVLRDLDPTLAQAPVLPAPGPAEQTSPAPMEPQAPAADVAPEAVEEVGHA